MLDDRKHSEEVKVRLTERGLVDLGRLSAAEDRKPAEMIRHMLRLSMYGRVACCSDAGEVPVRGGAGCQ